MGDHIVAKVGDIDEGERIIVQLEGREIAIFNRGGEYKAYVNWCAHQGGPACEGHIDGTIDMTFDKDTLETDFNWVSEGDVIACPWHGWEFDLNTGECLSRRGVGLPTYPVKVDNSDIIVSI